MADTAPGIVSGATQEVSKALNAVPGTLESGANTLAGMPQDIANLPLIAHMEQVMPAADLAFGGAMLVFIVLFHGMGIRAITGHLVRRSQYILSHPTFWRADLLMGSTVFALLALHVVEIFLWAASMIYSGMLTDWRAAGFFAGNTYTTIGYGNFVLPLRWNMMAPIIAISGLFTFGWSASVLVDLVGRCQKIKDIVAARAHAARHDARDPVPGAAGNVESGRRDGAAPTPAGGLPAGSRQA
jgi:hypothetical protein